jgi:hypothetical protein
MLSGYFAGTTIRLFRPTRISFENQLEYEIAIVHHLLCLTRDERTTR